MRESFCSLAPHGGERVRERGTLLHFVEEREQAKHSQKVRCARRKVALPFGPDFL